MELDAWDQKALADPGIESKICGLYGAGCMVSKVLADPDIESKICGLYGAGCMGSKGVSRSWY